MRRGRRHFINWILGEQESRGRFNISLLSQDFFFLLLKQCKRAELGVAASELCTQTMFSTNQYGEKKRLLQRSRAVSVRNGNGPNLILSTKRQLLHIKNLSCLSSPSNMNMHVEDADTRVASDLPFKVKSAFRTKRLQLPRNYTVW